MASTACALPRITSRRKSDPRGLIDRRRAGSRRCQNKGPSRAGALGCNQVVERLDLSVQHVEIAFAAGAVLAQGGGLARLRRLVEMAAVGPADLARVGGVEPALAHPRPAHARGSKLGALTAV